MDGATILWLVPFQGPFGFLTWEAMGRWCIACQLLPPLGNYITLPHLLGYHNPPLRFASAERLAQFQEDPVGTIAQWSRQFKMSFTTSVPCHGPQVAQSVLHGCKFLLVGARNGPSALKCLSRKNTWHKLCFRYLDISLALSQEIKSSVNERGNEGSRGAKRQRTHYFRNFGPWKGISSKTFQRFIFLPCSDSHFM